MSCCSLLFEQFFRLGHVLGTLINQINLARKSATYLKVWQSNSFEILPMPAPQSSTLPRWKFGNILTTSSRNPSEKCRSFPLSLPYPPRTPSYDAYVFFIKRQLRTNNHSPSSTSCPWSRRGRAQQY